MIAPFGQFRTRLPAVCCCQRQGLSITRGRSTHVTVAIGSELFCKGPVHLLFALLSLTGSITPPRLRMGIQTVNEIGGVVTSSITWL